MVFIGYYTENFEEVIEKKTILSDKNSLKFRLIFLTISFALSCIFYLQLHIVEILTVSFYARIKMFGLPFSCNLDENQYKCLITRKTNDSYYMVYDLDKFMKKKSQLFFYIKITITITITFHNWSISFR